jgi:protocatechuate 3,4-dioxygenase beta subunit
MSISTRKVFLLTALSVALLLTLALPAAAQMTRAVKGKVTDEKGEPVKDAQIDIQQTDSY